jgi:hypothetical protein
LLLEGHDSVQAWGDTADDLMHWQARLSNLLEREIRSSVLSREQIVKPREVATRPSPEIQLRYIEVPPRVLEEYREWRKRTIFPYVRQCAHVDGFTAFYSLLSGRPGVTFFSEYSCDRETYLGSFATPAYTQIVNEAGQRFIADGVAGLRTEEWSLLGVGEPRR